MPFGISLMLRRNFLQLALGPRVDYRDYSRVWPDYLSRLAQQAYQRRNRDLAAVRTPPAARRRQQWARETFWRLTGGEPARTPLNTRVTGSFERPAWRVEKLVYESRPGFHIPANLYIPNSGRPPYPGVLFQMGHTLNGKAAALYQYCCQGLVQLGFVVLAFDPMGQGERTYYPRAASNLTRLGSADGEHTVPGKQLILTGDTATRLQVWDAVRSLDYLASHPLVDPTRLASTGQSGGGTLTMLLACVDDRLACAAPASANTENLACANFNPPGSTDDAEQDFLNAGPDGFDRWDTLYPFAPKPLLLINSGKDFFGTYSPRYIENGREEFEKLARVYAILGKRADIEWVESPLPHGMSYDIRMAIYNWFRRHLQSNAPPLDQEPPVKAEPDDMLHASPTGNVVRDFGGVTPLQLARDRAAAVTTPDNPADLARLLSTDPPRATLAVKGITQSRLARIEAVEIESAAGVWLPAWVFRPLRAKENGPLIILLDPGGRNARWSEDALCQQLAARGFPVCAPDLRGIGDLRPEYPRHAPGHGRSHQEEEAWAWASMMLGKPVLGQRVTDILALVRAFAPRHRIALASLGRMTPPALFAAAMEPAISSVYLAGGIASFRSLLETETYTEPFANFLFDVLRHTDLPQLARSIAGRRVILTPQNTWDIDSLSQL